MSLPGAQYPLETQVYSANLKQINVGFVLGLDAENCQGLVAFPKLVDRQKYLLKELQTIGELFGVKVIELES